MVISERAGSRRKRRMILRWLASLVPAAAMVCCLSGCSALSLGKSPPQRTLSNPWIKPAKPETTGEKIKGFFWKEKKAETPKDWINQQRPE
jgi:hypothetical protein